VCLSLFSFWRGQNEKKAKADEQIKQDDLSPTAIYVARRFSPCALE